LRRACHRINPAISVHGMRSTFRDWVGDNTKFPRELAELQQALRRMAKAVAAGRDPKGCLQAASGIVVRILWSTYQRKRLELAGLNLGEDRDYHFTSEDYAGRYQDEVAKNKEQASEIAALREQVVALGGLKERPRPPRPALN
jgi:hypothetical protein